MGSKLSEDVIKKLPVPASGNRVTYFAGAVLQGTTAPRGFGVRVTAGGARSFVLNYRLRGREHRFTIGAFPDWSALKAVKEASALRRRVDKGENPIEARKPLPKSKCVTDVLDAYIEEKARGKADPLRGADAIESAFNRLVKPAIGRLGVGDLTKDHILAMRKKVARDAGPVMADRSMAYFRAAMRWFVEECQGGSVFDTRQLPAGSLTSAKGRRRTRTLSAEEIKLIWPMLEAQGNFGAVVKLLLLTGQRRNEVGGMVRAEIGADGVWEIPAERYKSKHPHFVPLSRAALAIIHEQLKITKSDYVFPTKAGTAFSSFAFGKAALDAAVLQAMREAGEQAGDDPDTVKPLPNWTLHDLRRTARTLMSGVGVPSEIAERVLGHAMGSLEATYDRHDYEAEKRDALERLAARIESIVTPPPANVADLAEGRAANR
jgi:integrase